MSVDTRQTREYLESLSKNLNQSPPVLIAGERRRQARRKLRADCDVYLFYGPGFDYEAVEAVARNVTFDGVSVISGLNEPIRAGRPVEVHVPFLGGPLKNLAGTVVFCRRLEAGSYEIGVSVLASSSSPVLTSDPEAATCRYKWFTDALGSRAEDDEQRKT